MQVSYLTSLIINENEKKIVINCTADLPITRMTKVLLQSSKQEKQKEKKQKPHDVYIICYTSKSI